MRASLLPACVLLLGTATADKAANFDISLAQAAAHDCDIACMAAYAAVQSSILGQWGSAWDDKFYSTAANFTESKPGDLLKLQRIDASTLKNAANQTLYKMQYTTVDLDGSLAPCSGFIALPSTPQKEKHRLLAWAHGTSGLEERCAPSTSPTLYDAPIDKFLAKGYAIVGTDYVGLGNNYTTHKYLSASAQASDVYYSTLAARKAFGNMLSEAWMSYGHSQGGGVSWKLAESAHVKNDKNYLGTVAMSPATHIVEAGLVQYDTFSYPAIAAALQPSLSRAYPNNVTGNILSDVSFKRFQLEKQAQMCGSTVFSMFVTLDKAQVVNKTAVAEMMPQFEAWQSREAPALGDKSPAPVLVIQGLSDDLVQPNTTVDAVETSKRAGNDVKLSLYKGQDHAGVIKAASDEYVAWIDAAFEKAEKSSKI